MLITTSFDDILPRTYKDFTCGIVELDEYLKRYAKKNHRNDIGKTFVYLENDIVIGYYTISMSSVSFHDLPEIYKSRIPKYPIPVAQIGRLAVSIQLQGRAIGSSLLFDAFRRIKTASQIVAAFAVIVDAKNEKAVKFYKKFSFIEYKGNPLSLFLPMSRVNELIEVTEPAREYVIT